MCELLQLYRVYCVYCDAACTDVARVSAIMVGAHNYICATAHVRHERLTATFIAHLTENDAVKWRFDTTASIFYGTLAV